ncbi:MAG: branched-chain amino acid ABC transporter permease [Deltaproteobacteria bacterium]|nr:branched-chain amino acid ABC transporter permease [Deltaproteobacteria bacterium]
MNQDLAARLRRELAGAAIVMICAALLPLMCRQTYWLGVIIVAMYYALLGSAWNLAAGFTGQFSLAPATFGMLGAYIVGFLNLSGRTDFLAGILLAAIGAGLVGLLLGRMVFRLKGPYFALVTLAFAEIARLVISNAYDFTRGDLGLSVAGPSLSRLEFYYLFWAVLSLTLAGLYLLLRSPAGLYLQAIRGDEIAAAARGVRVIFWKTAAFGLSAALSGLAGGLYVSFIQLASPEMGTVLQTGYILSLTIIGGLGTLIGPILGGFVLQISSEALRAVGVAHMLVFSVVIILIGRFFRTGGWGLILFIWNHRFSTK